MAVGATTSLGDLMGSMRSGAQSRAQPAPRGAIRRCMRDYFLSHPDKVLTAPTMGPILRARGFITQTDKLVGHNLAMLCKERFLKRLDKGAYKLAAAVVEPKRVAAAPVEAPVRPAEQPLVAAAASLKELVIGDDHELNDALTALANIESGIRRVVDEALPAIATVDSLVRKYKGALQQLGEVRRILDTLGIGR